MSILVLSVGWLVRNSHRKQRDKGGNQIQAGVGGLRKNAQALRGNAHQKLQDGNGEGGEKGIEGHQAFLGTHVLQHRIHLGSGHAFIVSVFANCMSYNDLHTSSPLSSNGKVYFKMIRTLVVLALALIGATAESQNPATAPKPRTASSGQSSAAKKPPVASVTQNAGASADAV